MTADSFRALRALVSGNVRRARNHLKRQQYRRLLREERWLLLASEAVTVQMRYSLTSPSEAACFTLLQYDSAGKEIAINQVDGIAGNKYWTWTPKAPCIHTFPDAATIRI